MIGAFLTSCGVSEPPAVPEPPEALSNKEIEFECAANVSVYEVVVRDFLTNSEATFGLIGETGVVVVEPQSTDPKQAQRECKRFTHYLEDWQEEQVQGLLPILIRANESADEVSFRNPIQGVTLQELDRWTGGYANFDFIPAGGTEAEEVRAKIEFLAPAISEDGSEALVHFSFWPSDHGAESTYFLDRCPGDGWKVRWFDYTYFL